MYKFTYDHWDEERFPGYRESMNAIYDRSTTFYLKYDLEEYPNNNEFAKLMELFGYMEYYYAALLKMGFVDNNNFSNVLEQLKNIRLIRLMDPSLRKRFNGLTHHNIIMMNPTPGRFPNLDQEESLQLATFHELGHIITSSNTEDIEYLKQVILKEPEKIQKDYPEGIDYWKKGFELLDEVSVHNAAEAVLYDKIEKERPEAQNYSNPSMYSEGNFKSNFSEYREFQELAYTFACCLDFIPHKENDSMCDVLNNLSKAMFSRIFCTDMFLELTRNPSKGDDLVKMLICMGKVKDAKYACFGLESDTDTEIDVTKYIQDFYSIAEKYMKKKNSKTKQKIQG